MGIKLKSPVENGVNGVLIMSCNGKKMLPFKPHSHRVLHNCVFNVKVAVGKKST